MREQIANHSPVPRRATATQSYVPANPHKGGHYSGIHPEDQPYQSTDIEDDDSYYQVRQPTSARRYQTTEGNEVIQQGNKRLIIHKKPPPKKKTHWMLFLGLGMVVAVFVFIGLSQLSTWWSNHQLDATYGNPRTAQYDQRVGFGDDQTPTHFIAINLNGQTETIVCPASNCTKAVVYLGPRLFGNNAALVPVTLTFDSKNMIMHVGDQEIIFINTGTQFKLQQ